MTQDRPTAEFTTTGGRKIVHYTYINKLEEREITEIYLKAQDEKEKNGQPVQRPKFVADDKAFELVIVSMDGIVENTLQRVLQLPTSEYNEISEVVKRVVEPEKK